MRPRRLLGLSLGVAVVVMVGCSAPVPVAEHPTIESRSAIDDAAAAPPVATVLENVEVTEPSRSGTEEAQASPTEPARVEGGSQGDDPVLADPELPHPNEPVEPVAPVESGGSVPVDLSIGPGPLVDVSEARAPSPVALDGESILSERSARASAGSLPPLRSAAARAQPMVLERGHVDLVEVSLDNGRLTLLSKDHTTPGGPTFRTPAEVQIRVKDRARTEVPAGGAYGFLGAPGSTVWLLPQTEDPGLVWPGWSTERLRAGQVAGDRVTWRLLDVKGPGAMTLFTTDQFGSPSVIFASGGGVPNETTIRVNTHAHGNWAFTAPGAYQVTFEVAADVVGVGPTASRATWVFLVGDGTAVLAPEDVPAAETGVQPTRPPSAPGSTGSEVAGGAAGRAGGERPTTAGAAPPTGVAGTSQDAVGGSGSGALPLTGTATVPLGVVGATASLLGWALLRLSARGRDRIRMSVGQTPAPDRAR